MVKRIGFNLFLGDTIVACPDLSKPRCQMSIRLMGGVNLVDR
jgi:hypothetical protein